MKRLLQTFACVLLAAVLVFVATHTTPEVTEETVESKEEKTTIRIWYTDENMTDYLNSAAVAYSENSMVRVLPVLVDDNDYLKMVNYASVNDEQAPDLFLVGNDSLEEAYLAGIADEISNDRFPINEETFPQAAVHAVTYHDKIVAYPLYFDSCVLLYNDTYLEMWADQQAVKHPEEVSDSAEEGNDEIEEMDHIPEEDDSIVEYDEETINLRKMQYWEKAVPSTIEDILNFADTFDPPQELEGIFAWDVSDIMFNYSFVGDAINVGGVNGDDRNILDVYNEKTVEALKVYQGLNQFFFMETEGMDYDSLLQDFYDGKYVFTIVKTDAVKKLQDAVDEGRFTGQYGFVTMPDPTETTKGKSLSVTCAVAVNGFSEKKDLANDFAAFLTGEYAMEMYDRSGKIPAIRSAVSVDSPQYVFTLEYDKSVSLPKIMECSNYWLQLENIFSQVWNGDEVEEQVKELEDLLRSQMTE